MKSTIAILSLCFVAVCAQLDGQTYASIGPAKYSVNLSFKINGAEVAGDCTLSAPGSACLPVLNAGSGDAIIISYAVNTTTPANATSTITLKGCYGPQSSVNRAWRKPNPVIKKDKNCSVKIATGLPPSGEFTWTLKDRAAPAVYRILAMEICEGGAACAMGLSTEYFQTLPINSTPKWLVIMTSCFATLGPIVLVLFFFHDRVMKKRL